MGIDLYRGAIRTVGEVINEPYRAIAWCCSGVLAVDTADPITQVRFVPSLAHVASSHRKGHCSAPGRNTAC